MEFGRKPFYLGIDLNDKYAMISFYQQNMGEPETVSAIAGSEVYAIPMVLAKRKGLGQWYYGDEAVKMAKTSEVICVDSLLRRAMNGESLLMDGESFKAEDLLGLYIRKLIQLSQKLGNPTKFDRLVITVDRLDKDNMDLFWRIARGMDLTQENFMVMDHKESFYYYALSQQNELWMHDVYLIECENGSVSHYAMTRNTHTVPQVVEINEGNRILLGDNQDEGFLQYQMRIFENRVISAVYLVGDGFEGNWMKDSLNYLCKGRRAFIGRNLFSKGACYGARVRDLGDKWPFIYMGENEMKFNISIKVRSEGELQFLTLISAGKNWFEESGECEVILSQDAKIDFWKQLPRSAEAQIETLELTDLPKRPDRTTRLRISARPISDDKVTIEIRDLGFGEIVKGTDKSWKYTMFI